MRARLPWDADMLACAERQASPSIWRVMAKLPDGSPGIVCHYFGDAGEKHAKDMMASYGRGAWVEGQRFKRPATERVHLLDGEADQCLVPGVAPVPLALRQCEQEAKRRQARRLGNTLPAGGLFDETARAQADLF